MTTAPSGVDAPMLGTFAHDGHTHCEHCGQRCDCRTLYAAAPDLLAALEYADTMLSAHFGPIHYGQSEVGVRVRNAIAKARP